MATSVGRNFLGKPYMDSNDSPQLGPAEAAAWDCGCGSDEARNRFVIPSVERLIKQLKAKAVLDLGCGTGYLCQRLSELEVCWTLLDRSGAMMDFARRALAGKNNISYVAASLSVAVERQLVSTYDVVLSAYSILEVDDLPEFAKDCRLTVRENGILAIYIPDCLEDVAPGLAFERFRVGMAHVRKLNAFTGTQLVFLARRVEHYLAAFTTEGFALVALEEFVSSVGKRHFGLVFKRF
jgi:2-polyprenyl-3-methyl-5-hydroxy-6-metoxy-1,4-benzoquinol methylase